LLGSTAPHVERQYKGAFMLTSCIRIAAIVCAGFLIFQPSAYAQSAIDNSALSSKEFREHKRTFGLVYRANPART
jgi:hypothetical protein